MNFKRKKFHGRKKHDDDSDKPLEFSSKKRPPILKIFTDKRKVVRDPRFEETSGTFNPTIFEQKYGNIIKEAKDKDKNELLSELKREKDPERITQIKYLLKRISEKEHAEEHSKNKLQLVKKLKEEKRKQLKLASKGPVFLKKSEIKQAQLVEKFKELKQSQKLSKYIEKKRKRNVARERNKMFSDNYDDDD
ncbi:ribosomal RNA processing protein 36 homolog [Tetranychus urticae]|uniref:rRNA biogenesis protein RRP36 n=1 Tax=Tetranychus urticae TaxID=32264 RepID=T1K801_TETUR|nr:ribosomal RNA processing protein 36 homolog [Tetranychus urticae]